MMTLEIHGAAPVRTGDRVRVFYNFRLGPGGKIVQSSAKLGPIDFEAGGSEVFPKIARSVVGARVGDVVKVELTATEAFGAIDPSLVRNVPASLLDSDTKEGERVTIKLDGAPVECTVRSRDAAGAIVDANHPFAGLDLVFEYKVKAILSRGMPRA